MRLNDPFSFSIIYQGSEYKLSGKLISNSGRKPHTWVYRVTSENPRFNDLIRYDRILVQIGEHDTFVSCDKRQDTLEENHPQFLKMLSDALHDVNS